MRHETPDILDRRRFLEASAALGLAVVGCGEAEAPASSASTGGTAAGGAAAGGMGGATTPACPSTSEDILGPYFKPESPERSVLVSPEDPGVRLRLSGRVLDSECKPIRNAVLDFWQADDAGAYDNEGFAFRGHVKVAQDGSYTLETILPGRYLNGDTFRPAHIHVKVYVGLEERLTTQLYFEGDPYNEADAWYEPRRALALENASNGKSASFDFAV
jgi:protocatechuate 3,4-dioxygenase beta subunit